MQSVERRRKNIHSRNVCGSILHNLASNSKGQRQLFSRAHAQHQRRTTPFLASRWKNSLLLLLLPISCQILLVDIVLYGLITQLADPKHTVPLLNSSKGSSSHAAGVSTSTNSGPLTFLCIPTPVTQDSEPLTSQPSTQDLPLSPPPSLPMVPHALPDATTLCCTIDKTLVVTPMWSYTRPTVIPNRPPLMNLPVGLTHSTISNVGSPP